MCHRRSVHCYAVSNATSLVPDKHTNRCRDKEHTFIQSNRRCGKMLNVCLNNFNRMSWPMLRVLGSFASGPFVSMRFDHFWFCNNIKFDLIFFWFYLVALAISWCNSICVVSRCLLPNLTCQSAFRKKYLLCVKIGCCFEFIIGSSNSN